MVSELLELQGGGIVQFYGSWIARGTDTSFDGDWHVECAGGQLRWESNRVVVRPVGPWLTIQVDGFVERRNGWMAAMADTEVAEDRSRVLEVFAHARRTGTPPPTNGHDNLRTAALSFATLSASGPDCGPVPSDRVHHLTGNDDRGRAQRHREPRR